MRLKAMALPSEVLYCNDINGLSEVLGKLGCIETKEISETPPKLSGLRRLASAAATTVYDAINLAHTPDQLDCLAKEMWGIHVEGAISEDDVTFLSSCIDRRRPMSRRTASGQRAPLSRLNGRLQSRFTSRQRKGCPDRKASRDRRRMLGGSSALPDNLRHFYTEGQRAVLCVVGGEVKRHGVCDLPIDQIAALAGVCRTTAQTAMHEARLLGHVTITERPIFGRKSLTNIVCVCSPAWLGWLKRGPPVSRFIGSNPVKRVSPTKIIELRKEEAGNKKDETEIVTTLEGQLRER
jgi:hypothetical protein